MFNFNQKTASVIKYIADFGQMKGISVYFVGGIVRDMLMGIEIKDIDILIEGSAIDFAENFYENFKDKLDIKIKSVHKSFNTAKTVIDGTEIDFASTREEEYPKSGCLPVVKNIGCDIKSDLKRRDFTVNAIAARILSENGCLKYEIIDEFNGCDDIRLKELKILHKNSYIDDPTRILRGIDFNLRFGFDFSSDDKKLIDEYLNAPNREGLSIDRVKLTLKKLFSDSIRAKKAYKIILENKIYKIWTDAPCFKIEWAERLSDAVDIFGVKPCDLFLGAIFNCDKYTEKYQGKTNYELWNFFKLYSNIDLALYYAIFNEDCVKFYFEKLKNVKPLIKGGDLINLGFNEGKIIGSILDDLQKEKLNNPLKFKNRQDEINFALKFLP